MLKKVTIFMITLFALLSGTASAQEFAVKSNLLYDATSTINLGVEYGLSPRWTLEVAGNYNAWTFSDNKKMKLWMLQPGVRYWTCSRFAGTSWKGTCLEANTTTAVCFLSASSPLHRDLGSKRYQGWLAGAGVGYGYSWVLGKRWNLEATARTGLCTLQLRPFRVQDVR